MQILPPERDDNPNTSDKWEYVQPQAGCAVVNMGYAMVEFSEGTVRSSLHRVNYAPGKQAFVDRYSVAYFARPEDKIMMKALDRLNKDSSEPTKTNAELTVKK